MSVVERSATAAATTIDRLTARLDRERAARFEAEAIAEATTSELYERKRVLEVLEAVAADANAADDLDAFLKRVLDRICAFAGWPLGHVYLADGDGALQPSAVWHADDPVRAHALIEKTLSTLFGPGEGLPGRVIASGEPAWISDVAAEPSFPRAEAARAAAVRSAVALPIIGPDERTLGAFEFFTTAPIDPNEQLLDALAQIGRHVGIFIERERAQDEVAERRADLEAANEELKEFAYVASHDLSEPLRTISGFVQLLASRYQGRLDDDADEFIGFVIDGTDRMQALIRDLLAYSRTGRTELEFEDVDLNEVVRGCLAMLGASIEESKADVQIGELPTVRGDRAQLDRLFSNLISNALKFHGEERPRVTVAAVPIEGGWRFGVADNGIGIEPRHVERVFKVFQRLHGIGEYPGTGVGLAICKKVVERHGGEITIEPNPGGGTVFRFTVCDPEAGT